MSMNVQVGLAEWGDWGPGRGASFAWFSSKRLSAKAASAAHWNRSTGSLPSKRSSHFRIPGAAHSVAGGTGVERWPTTTSLWVSPINGGHPVANSCHQPSEYRSVQGPWSRQRPNLLGCHVFGCTQIRTPVSRARTSCGSRRGQVGQLMLGEIFRLPSRILPGLMSQCRMPRECALESPLSRAMQMPYRSAQVRTESNWSSEPRRANSMAIQGWFGRIGRLMLGIFLGGFCEIENGRDVWMAKLGSLVVRSKDGVRFEMLARIA